MSHRLIWKADGGTRGAEEALGVRVSIHATSNSHWKLGLKGTAGPLRTRRKMLNGQMVNSKERENKRPFILCAWTLRGPGLGVWMQQGKCVCMQGSHGLSESRFVFELLCFIYSSVFLACSPPIWGTPPETGTV